MPRAITNETRSSSLKKFKANPAVNGGLCIGALVDVTVTDAEIKANSPMLTFQGTKAPRLNFVFESQLDPVGVKKSTYIESYLPIEHNVENHGPDGVWRWNQLSQMVKHILEVYRDYKPFTQEEEVLLGVDYADEDENGIYIECDGALVSAAYRKFFGNIVNMLKPADKAIYLDEKGQPKPAWMKLILDYKGKNVNGGDFGFPGYPGEGVIELMQKGVPPSIYINVAKGENIIAKAPVAATSVPTPTPTGASATTQADLPEFLRGNPAGSAPTA